MKNQRDWAKNLTDHAPAQLAGVEGWDAARIAAFVTRVQKMQVAAQAVLDVQATVDAATGALDAVLADELPEIRQNIGNMKKSRGWNDGKGTALGVNTPAASLDPATLQPGLSVDEKKGRNEVMAKKYGADSLNIYVRTKGQPAFRLLAAKRVRFPLDDDTPSADGRAEEREYQALAVLGDEEAGQPSDIVAAVWRP